MAAHEEGVTDSPTGWVKRHVRRYLETDGEEGHEWRGAPSTAPPRAR